MPDSPRRWVVYLKLFAVLIFIGILAAATVFVLRFEEYLLSKLPQQVSVGHLSLSLWNRGFVLRKVIFRGAPNTPCADKNIAQIEEVDGTFELVNRRLAKLRISDLTFVLTDIKPNCLLARKDKQPLLRRDIVSSAGLSVVIKNARITMPQIGQFTVDSNLQLNQIENGPIELVAEKLLVKNDRFRLDTQKLVAGFNPTEGGFSTNAATILATLRIPRLEKLPRLNTPRLRVLTGQGLVKLAADARGGLWTTYTSIELTNVKVEGEPVNRMPLAILEFTPQTLWPMIEDSKGVFRFAFKSKSAEQKIARAYAADLQKAFMGKVKTNLKKKIPVLPF